MAIFSKPIFPSHPLPIPDKFTQRPIVLAFLVIILLRSRAFTLSKDVIKSIREKAHQITALKTKRKLSKDELAKVLQQVYIDEEDGSQTLLVPYRERVIKVPIHPTPKSQYAKDAPHFPLLPPQAIQKPNIDGAFVAQLRAILFRIAIPSWYAPEAGIVVLHSSFLILRTVLSILVARLDGRIVRDLVKADGKGFLKGLGLWFLLAIPSTFTNSMIRHLQSLLALRLRTRLTRYLHDLYLSSNPDLRYYRASNYLEGVDQYLTADVDAWANAMSGLYGNILKPSLDLLLFTSQLSRSLGVRGSILLFLNYYGTVAILRAVTPAFGRLASVEARLEGEYRAGMGRVGREAEEIAFYDGGAREKDILTNAYTRLIKHINSIYKIRIAYEWTEDYVIKYLWSAAGYALIAVPILYTRTKQSLGSDTPHQGRDRTDNAIAGRTETYISNRRLLLSLADAGGRLMYAYKDLLELAGLTTRLYTLCSTLLNMPPGYVPVRVEQLDPVSLLNVDVRVPRLTKGENAVVETQAEKDVAAKKERDEPPLVKDLNLVIQRGEHMMITGSNGVGKTAVARVLAGLWDPVGSGDAQGTVKMPADETEAEVMFRQSLGDRHSRPRPTLYVVPQRSYMPVGSLLEQIIYPCSYASFVRMTSSPSSSPSSLVAPPSLLRRSTSFLTLGSIGVSSSSPSEPTATALAEIHEILEKVHLGYLVGREGGLHVRKEWRDVLSGGEKQRMAIARVLWWRPKFAVLDECTSAVSSDVEGRMYEAAKALDITLITISLRPFLMKYHNQLLTLHGPSGSDPGKWTLSRIGTPEERMSLNREIGVLEEKLKEVEGWEKRVKELEVLLGVQEGIEDEEVDRKEEEELAILEQEKRDEEARQQEEEEEESSDGDGEEVSIDDDAETFSLQSASEADRQSEDGTLTMIEEGLEEAVTSEELEAGSDSDI